jgi:hypothetical protein
LILVTEEEDNAEMISGGHPVDAIKAVHRAGGDRMEEPGAIREIAVGLVEAVPALPREMGIAHSNATVPRVQEVRDAIFRVKEDHDVIVPVEAVRKSWLPYPSSRLKSFPRPKAWRYWPGAFACREELIHCLILPD